MVKCTNINEIDFSFLTFYIEETSNMFKKLLKKVFHKKCPHECKCECHKGKAHHFMPCCGKCVICQRNIELYKITNHQSICHQNIMPSK